LDTKTLLSGFEVLLDCLAAYARIIARILLAAIQIRADSQLPAYSHKTRDSACRPSFGGNRSNVQTTHLGFTTNEPVELIYSKPDKLGGP
jgi:hypothetical protein